MTNHKDEGKGVSRQWSLSKAPEEDGTESMGNKNYPDPPGGVEGILITDQTKI